jgi:ornithine--oxo-acid transaminase
MTAGFYPQSFILGTAEVMSLVGIAHIASTYAMTPMAIAAVEATLEVIDQEHLMERAKQLGEKWRAIVNSWKHPNIAYVVGRNVYYHSGFPKILISIVGIHRCRLEPRTS